MSCLFYMSADTACKVFEAFVMVEALNEKERLAVLAKFVEDGSVGAFNSAATTEEIVRQLAEHFHLLKIERKKRGPIL